MSAKLTEICGNKKKYDKKTPKKEPQITAINLTLFNYKDLMFKKGLIIRYFVLCCGINHNEVEGTVQMHDYIIRAFKEM